MEPLTCAGRADQITTLAAQRLADPVPALRLELPSERASLTTARHAFADGEPAGAAADDVDALHLALVEVLTTPSSTPIRAASLGPSSSRRPSATMGRGAG